MIDEAVKNRLKAEKEQFFQQLQEEGKEAGFKHAQGMDYESLQALAANYLEHADRLPELAQGGYIDLTQASELLDWDDQPEETPKQPEYFVAFLQGVLQFWSEIMCELH